jgi:hypothetical protein
MNLCYYADAPELVEEAGDKERSRSDMGKKARFAGKAKVDSEIPLKEPKTGKVKYGFDGSYKLGNGLKLGVGTSIAQSYKDGKFKELNISPYMGIPLSPGHQLKFGMPIDQKNGFWPGLSGAYSGEFPIGEDGPIFSPTVGGTYCPWNDKWKFNAGTRLTTGKNRYDLDGQYGSDGNWQVKFGYTREIFKGVSANATWGYQGGTQSPPSANLGVGLGLTF